MVEVRGKREEGFFLEDCLELSNERRDLSSWSMRLWRLLWGRFGASTKYGNGLAGQGNHPRVMMDRLFGWSA